MVTSHTSSTVLGCGVAAVETTTVGPEDGVNATLDDLSVQVGALAGKIDALAYTLDPWLTRLVETDVEGIRAVIATLKDVMELAKAASEIGSRNR